MTRFQRELAWALAPILLFMAAACGRVDRAQRPRLALDLRPVMATMRLDARTVRAAVERGNLQAGRKAIERMRGMRMARPGSALPEDFMLLEQAFQQRAAALAAAIEAGDRAAAEPALAAVLGQCNACHEAFRPLGASDALLR